MILDIHKPSGAEYTKIVQISDCHLLEDAAARYKNVCPKHGLDLVCESITDKHPDADLLLLTGDLSQDESAASYQLLSGTLHRLNIEAYAIPGNHDDLNCLQASCGNIVNLGKSIELNHWRLLLLSSQLPGHVEGQLSDEELYWLSQQLSMTQNQHALIALHHQPYLTGSEWMDRIGLKNRQSLLSVLEDYPQVRVLIHGHTHQVGYYRQHQLSCYGTPSSWRQFIPNSPECRMDNLPPAYRVVQLHKTGAHRSWVEFV